MAIPDSNTRSNYVGKLYQIRTKRVGGGRLVTMQAGTKNRPVLLVKAAAAAATILVNNVFNFLQTFKLINRDKKHYIFV